MEGTPAKIIKKIEITVTSFNQFKLKFIIWLNEVTYHCNRFVLFDKKNKSRVYFK